MNRINREKKEGQTIGHDFFMIVAFVRLRQKDCYKFVSSLHYRERIRKKKKTS